MKFVRYGKYTGEPAGAVDLEELVRRLGDFFLQSGYNSQFYGLSEFDPERTMDALREAILRALQEGDLFPENAVPQELRRFLQDSDAMQNESVRDLLDQLIERMGREGFINPQQPPQITPPPEKTPGGSLGAPQEREGQARFEITDKTIDFLGFKTLQELLGSLGRSSFGRHDTRDLATGVESGGVSRPYEFGDTLNLDVSETLFNAVRRDGAKLPIELTYSDLAVHQCEYQSSCATVLMLDCSHSMILYGEDRFTPAKRVALALSHLIRTQYPGDSLSLVLFHDSAEEVPLAHLARVQVGPYYTNTREGLRLAQRILLRQKKDMRQIVMITDGKPSALTMEDGRIYKNAFGLDPFVVSETLEEVNKCKRSGILINTFMLASDYSLVHFVQKVTEMCRGKAYFTTPYTLGQYLLMDFMNRKTRHIH
ncbi:MAG TPA: VWA domain-containing protein [Methylomirabilota bacterium]|nr:VWA domain-containing protein [Methylomirabilota bacterium]